MAYLLPPAGVKSFKDEAFMFNTVRTSNFSKRPASRIPSNIHSYRWFDYKATDRQCKEAAAAIDSFNYKKSQREMNRIERSEFNPAGPCPHTVKEQWRVPPCPCPQHRGVGYKGGRGCACMAGTVGEQGERYSSTQAPTGAHPYTRGGGDGLGVHPKLHTQTRGVAGTADWGYCPPVGLDPRCLVRPRDKTLSSQVRPTGAPYFAQEQNPSCQFSFEPPVLQKGVFTFDDWLRTEDQRQPPAHLQGMCVPSICRLCCPPQPVCDPLAYTLVYRP